MMCSRRLSHFDEVEIADTPKTQELEIAGAIGVIVGVTEEGGKGEPVYAVMIESVGRTVMARLSDLHATGRRVDPNEVYDGTSVRVTQSGEAGRPSEGEERDFDR